MWRWAGFLWLLGIGFLIEVGLPVGFILVVAGLCTLMAKCHGDEYQGWVGRWETVVATAYTPSDPIDSAYHATKGERWRWITANGHTDVRRVPYGVAVPLRQGDPWWAFGTRLIIPTGLGYLDRLRADEREFVVDDVGNGADYFPTEHGCLHIDLRFVDRRDAIRWAGPEGKRRIQVFVCAKRAPVRIPAPAVLIPEPEVRWPVAPPPPPLPPEPSPVTQAEMRFPLTDFMLLCIPLIWAQQRFRRRESWEPSR